MNMSDTLLLCVIISYLIYTDISCPNDHFNLR